MNPLVSAQAQSRVSFADDLERPPTASSFGFAPALDGGARPDTASSAVSAFGDSDGGDARFDSRPDSAQSVRFAPPCATG